MSNLKIKDVIEIPKVKPNLVVKVGEINNEQKRLAHVRDYVITDSIAKDLESLVKSIAESAQSSFDGLGIWLDGSFGSGKSHFSTFLGMLLTNDRFAWKKDHPVIQELADYRKILEKYPVFIVPVNALDVPDSLKRNFFTSVNNQLKLFGYDTVELSSATQLIQAFEKNAEDEDAFWNLLFKRSLTVTCRQEYDEIKEEDVDALASQIRKHVFGGAERAIELYDEMPEGIKKITEHLKKLGFSAIVVLLDEITLFLQGKNDDTKSRTLAELNRLLEHENSAIPVWAIVSRHLALEDLVGTERMEHLRGRFQKQVEMQDVELYEVCSKRVLKSSTYHKDMSLQESLELNIKNLPQEQFATLQELYGGKPQLRSALEKLYPFHPTIIDTLVAITHKLSRERTAISMMYDMLFDYADETLGEWIPYAKSFDYLFSGGQRLLQGHSELLAAWQLIKEKIEPNLSELFDQKLTDKAAIVARTLVLGQLTDRPRRLCDTLTPEMISALNASILNQGVPFIVEQEMTEILETLVERIPNFQRRGPRKYGVELSIGPDPEQALKELPVANLGNERIKVILKLLSELVGVSDSDGKRDNYKITWRGTDRRGLISAVQPQAISNQSLSIPKSKEYLLIICFPQEDTKLLNSLSLKLDKQLRTIWKPDFLPQSARDRLDKLAKISWALESNAGRSSVEQRYGKEDVKHLQDQWRRMRDVISERLLSDFEQCYLNGTVVSSVNVTEQLTGSTTKEAMDDLISRMFQRRFAQHPEFAVTVSAKSLDKLFRAIVQNPKPVNEDDSQYSLALSIGKPLEIYRQQGNSLKFDIGNAKRLKFLEGKIEERKRGQVKWLKEQMYSEFGLQGPLVELLLKLLIAFRDYRAQRGNVPVFFDDLGDISLTDQLLLSRAQLVTDTEWHQFLSRRDDLSLPQFVGELKSHTQDKVWVEFKDAVKKAHDELFNKKESLDSAAKRLEISPDKASIPDANAWLKYVSDIKNLSQKETAEAIKGVLKLAKPQKSLDDAKKQVQKKFELLTNAELKRLKKDISKEGQKEAKEQIGYLASGEIGLDEAKNELREIRKKYLEHPKPEVTKLSKTTIEFSVSKNKLLKAFGNELGENKTALESCEAEELDVQIKLSS